MEAGPGHRGDEGICGFACERRRGCKFDTDGGPCDIMLTALAVTNTHLSTRRLDNWCPHCPTFCSLGLSRHSIRDQVGMCWHQVLPNKWKLTNVFKIAP